MSYADKFLKYCTASVILKGTSLRNGNRVQKLLQIILLCCCFSSNMYSLGRWFEYPKLQNLKNDQVFRIITDVSAASFGILFPLWFIYKKQPIIHFTRGIFRLLDTPCQERVTKVSLVMLTLDVAFTLLSMPLSLWNDYIVNGYLSFTYSVLRVIAQLAIAFTVTGCCLYITFLYLLHTLVGHLFQSIKRYLKKVDKPDFFLINKVLHLILEFLRKFESNFSFLPLTWFSNTLFFTCVNILIMSAKEKVPSTIFVTAIFAIENVATLAVVILLFQLRNEWQKQCDSLYQDLVVTDRQSSLTGSFVKSSILKILDSIGSFRMTAMSLFYLDLSIILSLAGTVLTFTALFTQLTY